MSRRIHAIMKLAAVSNLGPSKTRKLFSKLQQDDTELQYLLEYSQGDLESVGLSEDQATQFLDTEPLEEVDHMVEQGLEVTTTLDSNAPRKLVNSKSSPWYFYVGRLDILNSISIGFAGSRDASPEAIDITTSIARSASLNGWSVVSGGARGVDITSHSAAIQSGGETVIMLPQGIATWRMPEELDMERVLILSEFLPFDDWGAYRAMQRNKSVVELSDLIIIPQSGERGGTWNAGEYAIKQKKPIYVAELGDQYPGNQKLLRHGARPLVTVGGRYDLEKLLNESTPDDGPAQATLF